MLSRKIPKLKLWSRLDLKCKGRSSSNKDYTAQTNTNISTNSINNTKVNNNLDSNKVCKSYNLSISKSKQLGKHLLQGVPVLSIFALLGIVICGMSPITIKTSRCSAYDPDRGCGETTCVEGYYLPEGSDCCAAVNVPQPTTPTPVTPSTSMVIDDGKIKDTILVAQGDFAYSTHKISVQANDIEDYTLTIAGPTNLTPPASGSTISGAGGKTVANMADNTWGYAWGVVGMNERTATYNSLSTSGASLRGDAVSGNATNWNRQLAFGAKFGNNAVSGTYSAEVTLSLVVTPKKLQTSIDDIKTMQEMYTGSGVSDVCTNSAVGESNTLTDYRDGSTYTVKKLNNSQCWMTQNLRLVNKTITAEYSDMESGSFAVPASSISGFSSNIASNVYYPNDTAKGTSYSWCAATAGSCTFATNSGVNAPSSICPRGWHLPVSGTGTTGTNTGATSDTKNDFMVLAGKTSTGYFTDASLVSGVNSNLGGVVWPFAGLYSSSSAYDVGSIGYYWSRTVRGEDIAYRLYINNEGGVFTSNYNGDRYLGCSVRCVAYSS